MQEDRLIEVRNVSKTFRVYPDKGKMLKEKLISLKRNKYQVKKVLQDVSFDVYRGESIGLIGHNGCGKSTLLKLLTEIIYPDKGTVTVKGRVSSLLELGAGFHPDMSGRDNIYINASIFGLTRKEIDERLDDIIEFSELGSYIDNPIRTYSSGMYMRLAFSVAINVDADILLVDEILAVGDVNFQKKCLDRLNEIKKKGVTIVLVSHSMNQIMDVCDRCIWIHDGRIAGIGSTELVTEQYLDYMGETKKNNALSENVAEEIVPKKVQSGFINLESVKLYNSADEECDRFDVADDILVKIRYTAKEAKEVRLTVDVVREDYVLCYASDYNNEAMKCSIGASGELELKLEKINLLNGKYYINIHAIDREGNPVFDLIPVGSFSVEAATNERGFMRINASLHNE